MTISEDESKSTVILLRCPDSLKAEAKETAAKEDTDLSKFIRRAIRREIAISRNQPEITAQPAQS